MSRDCKQKHVQIWCIFFNKATFFVTIYRFHFTATLNILWPTKIRVRVRISRTYLDILYNLFSQTFILALWH